MLAVFSTLLIGTRLLARVVASQPDAKMEQATGSPPQNIEWLAQLSGSLNSGFIQGDYAYFGIGTYLAKRGEPIN
ncbi:MAG: hypothetical protein CL608_08365 [Anaerolineaceae bacterium]|nr:hypothetical protein [Anaerolineaceae bacterium]